MTSNYFKTTRPLGVLENIEKGIDEEGYRIQISRDRIEISASSAKGFFYGKMTLEGIANKTTARALESGLKLLENEIVLAEGEINDYPSLKLRGVMLDISRTKVPTQKQLYEIVDLISSLKLNHLELYMEHTFAYVGHELVWENSDPLTVSELAALDSYCKERFVDLVCNQNSFGHMERWLIHPKYRDLGIEKDLVVSPFGMLRPPTTIDPTNERSIQLISDIMDQITDAIPSKMVNIGFDEPFELNSSRAFEWNDWLTKVTELSSFKDKDIIVWGDMLAGHKKLIEKLPDGVIVAEWGYEANSPFGERDRFLVEHQVPFINSPGTSSWLSIVGKTNNSLENTREATRNAIDHGGLGILTTDWGDFGHLQWWPISLPGIVAAGAFGWTGMRGVESFQYSDLIEGLSSVISTDPMKDDLNAASAICRIGEIHSMVPCQFPNLATIVLHLYFPQLPVGFGLTTGLTTEHLDLIRNELGEIKDLVSKVVDPLMKEELSATCSLVELIVDDASSRLLGNGHLASVSQPERDLFADRCSDIISLHQSIWKSRNRIGGLEESLAWLYNLQSGYISGQPDKAWAGPLKLL
ncbi:MAG: family 20 glycosylhydrolase [Acidimicrobiales bacterium]|nr:family 20 glycosylhydrolase [Acidimicrobiales bacterium]